MNDVKPIFENKREKNDFLIATLLIFLAGSFIFFQAFSSDHQSIADTEINKVSVIDTQTDRVPEEISQEPPPIGYTESNVIRKVEPLPIKEVVPEEKKPPMQIEVEVSEENDQLLPIMDNVENQKLDETVILESNMLENTKEEDPQTPTAPLEQVLAAPSQPLQECRISVGLYKNRANASDMFERLKRDFDPFMTELRNATHVGVYVDCDHFAAQQALNKLRNTYAKDAYLIK